MLPTKPSNSEQAAAGHEPTDVSPGPVRNRQNERSKKTVPGNMGELTLATPRDRLGTIDIFDPAPLRPAFSLIGRRTQLPPKHPQRIPGFDEQIIALIAKGLSTRDAQEILENLYGVEVSATLISEATADGQWLSETEGFWFDHSRRFCLAGVIDDDDWSASRA
jgi:transposase-like protein